MQRGRAHSERQQGPVADESNRPYVAQRLPARLGNCRPYSFTHSPSLVINTAVADHDMATLDRLKYRIQNHGEAPPAGASTDTKPYATTPLSTGSRNPAPAWSDPYIGSKWANNTSFIQTDGA